MAQQDDDNDDICVCMDVPSYIYICVCVCVCVHKLCRKSNETEAEFTSEEICVSPKTAEQNYHDRW